MSLSKVHNIPELVIRAIWYPRGSEDEHGLDWIVGVLAGEWLQDIRTWCSEAGMDPKCAHFPWFRHLSICSKVREQAEADISRAASAMSNQAEQIEYCAHFYHAWVKPACKQELVEMSGELSNHGL